MRKTRTPRKKVPDRDVPVVVVIASSIDLFFLSEVFAVRYIRVHSGVVVVVDPRCRERGPDPLDATKRVDRSRRLGGLAF